MTSKRALLRFVVPVVVIVAGASIAMAKTMGSGEIHACVGPAGFVRVVHEATDCRRSERPLMWNVQGPVGPQGPSQLNVTLRERRATVTFAPGDPEGAGVASVCGVGEVVVGGGLTGRSIGLEKLTMVGVGPFSRG